VDTLSVDAFLRTMLDKGAFHGTIELGDTMTAMGIGTVVAGGPKSKYAAGTWVLGMFGAQTVCKMVPDAMGPTKMLPLPGVPKKASLGLLGITTGLTAWIGVFRVLPQPRRGETVVVSAAAGATGSLAAQLCKLTGARVIGVAGGPKKCSFLTDTLKLDGAVDYKSSEKTMGEQLDALAPDGIDFFFDNAGGDILDAVLLRLNQRSRVVICGAASQYSGNLHHGKVQGPSEYLKLAERNSTMKGFVVTDYMCSLPRAIQSLLWQNYRGRVLMHEQVEKGIGAFAPAMEKMFTGGHIGKLLVDVKAGESE